MIAKVIWNIMKSGSGMDWPSSGAAVTPAAKDLAKPPMMPPSPGPKAREYPQTSQTMLISAAIAMHCISTESRFLA